MIRISSALARLAALALFVSFAGPAAAHGTATAEEIPANLAAPDGSVLLFELSARGVQIYTCAAKPDDATAFTWTFVAPEAELVNGRGEAVGSHFAGPTWQGNDGSAVVGAVVSAPTRRIRVRSPGSCSRRRNTRGAAPSRRSPTSSGSPPSAGSPQTRAATRTTPATRFANPTRRRTPSSTRQPRKPPHPRPEPCCRRVAEPVHGIDGGCGIARGLRPSTSATPID